jgi:hypothetical protein
MKATGYGRIDYRMNDNGEIFFLEINAMPGAFGCFGEENCCDHIIAKEKDFDFDKFAEILHKLALKELKKSFEEAQFDYST